VILRKGQREPLEKLLQQPVAGVFELGLHCWGVPGAIDYACFGVDADGRLSDDRYLVFYNQPATPCGAIGLHTRLGESRFACRLSLLPASIERLVFTATIDGDGIMRQLVNGYLRFIVQDREAARFAFTGSDCADEKALITGEIYRHAATWRFSAVAQGFDGGLAALVKHFGAEVTDA